MHGIASNEKDAGMVIANTLSSVRRSGDKLSYFTPVRLGCMCSYLLCALHLQH